MTWSPQQDAALKAVGQWARARKGPQVFRLFGYAGTGKTTLAKELADSVKGKVLYAAFTGKAALVMQTKGCGRARTIHSLIYKLDSPDGAEPVYTINHASDLVGAKLCVIDECSMVDGALAEDLLSFGVKVLVLGDPAQLPPVKGAGYFTSSEPDAMLTEVHRQAADNPIVRMSMAIREKQPLPVGEFGDSKVVRRADLDPHDVIRAGMVLVGRNGTRHAYNARLRELSGMTDPMPVVGDKLVCLRNNREKGLLNGGLWSVTKLLERTSDSIDMKIEPEDAGTDSKALKVCAHPTFFSGREHGMTWEERRDYDEFDYGRALTVHKSQGSQWDRVALFDESFVFREDRHRWLYTGVTRAAQQITVVI